MTLPVLIAGVGPSGISHLSHRDVTDGAEHGMHVKLLLSTFYAQP